jgi:hypothetical protein
MQGGETERNRNLSLLGKAQFLEGEYRGSCGFDRAKLMPTATLTDML